MLLLSKCVSDEELGETLTLKESNLAVISGVIEIDELGPGKVQRELHLDHPQEVNFP